MIVQLSSCKKEENAELLHAVQKTEDIGSLDVNDRQMVCHYTGTSTEFAYYAEYVDTLGGKYKGWLFNLYNATTKDLVSTLKVYHSRSSEPGKIIFSPGTYYTNSYQAAQNEVIIDFNMFKDGGLIDYRAIHKTPVNYLKVEKPTPDYTLITFEAEMNSSFLQSLQVSGRFRIKTDY